MPSVIIMAGGIGERFWPASTTNYPKQYLPLTGNLPMILETVYRVKELVGIERIYIITTRAQLTLAREILSSLPAENIIAEPEGRNTAPCLLLAVSKIKQQWGADEIVAVLAADSYIKDVKAFQDSLNLAFSTAQNNDEIITFGIKPNRPETGYGYIAFDKEVAVGVHKGVKFVEKPNFDLAMKYVNSGKFLWNSGMFIFQIQTFIDKLKNYAQDLYQGFLALEKAASEEEIKVVYHGLPKLSIDYGLMEKLSSFFVIPGDFGWDDLGTWRALETTNPKDENGNVKAAPTALFDVTDSIIYSKDKLVAAIGVKDVIIVHSEEAVLVCAKDRVQDVKKVVEHLKNNDVQTLVAATKEE